MSNHIPKGLEHEVAYPAEQDYHGHPNYFRIYLYLMGLFIVSLLAAFIPNQMLMLIVIFGTALIKAVMVVGKFMHLKWEPILLYISVGLVIFVLLAFFFGVIPDITFVERDVAMPN
jgi:caa(3)-type oxidase subunit IV